MTTHTNTGLDQAVRLADTEVYEEYLTLSPVAALPGGHDLLIRSRLDSARHPDALQTRYRTVLSTGAIERLHRHLGDYLAALPTSGEGTHPG
jgi:hypothetical protein